jgi:mRNA interferase RelE/StbE
MFELSARAEADMRALDPPVAARIFDAIERLAETGQGDVKKLKGSDREYRLRVGNWRVRFERLDSQTYVILRVLHRRDAYRG